MLQTKEGQRRRTCSKKEVEVIGKKAREEMEEEGKHKRGKKTEEEGRTRKAGEERKGAKSRKRREEKIKKRRRSTLRVLPAETRLTVYRRFNIPNG